MLSLLAVANYRSLRNLVVPLKRLNVITGANGSGKSSLYRAIRLLADTAQGRVISSLAREGGLQSTLWAGPEVISRSVRRGDYPVQPTARNERVSVRLAFATDRFSYLIDLGLPPVLEFGESAFDLDPEIKRELIWHGPVLRPSTMLVDRKRAVVRVRAESGDWNVVASNLATYDSVMGQIADPRNTPEILTLRESIRAWRFYDHFRADVEAPARRSQIGTRTPILADDGYDLAAAIQTIVEIGDRHSFEAAVSDAFPGGAVTIENDSGRFELLMQQHGLFRPMHAGEFSDGTLRYLLWIAALLTPRPPALMILNEPETSLHPDVLPALARLIAQAAQRSQLFVVTHSPKLIVALGEQPGYHSIQLEKSFGETVVSGFAAKDIPSWNWPAR
jgi:predicted ATPase